MRAALGKPSQRDEPAVYKSAIDQVFFLEISKSYPAQHTGLLLKEFVVFLSISR